jgi:hypothetical protein
MPLPWVRLDSNIGTHDKVLSLLAERDGAKAFVLYISALGYSGAHGTDGHIPKYALKVNHGTVKLATMLVDHRLWVYDEDGTGYMIKNWLERQEGALTTTAKTRAAKRAACKRWHGQDCGCWGTA